MNLDDLQMEIKARTAGETVAIAARLVQHRPGPLLGAWGFYSAGVILLALLLLWGLKLHWAWSMLLTVALAPAFSLPMVATAGHLVFSDSVRFGTVARAVLSRTPQFLALFLLGRALTALGLAALVFPGLYVWRNGWFLAPIVVLERSSAAASLRRGRRFALGYQGRVIGNAFHTLFMLLYLTAAAASLLHFLLVRVFGITFTALAQLPALDGYVPLLVLCGFALVAPLLTLAWFFVYMDIRIRKEGWDLEIAFRRRAAQMERARA